MSLRTAGPGFPPAQRSLENSLFPWLSLTRTHSDSIAMEAATKESLEERMASLFEQAQKTLSAHSGVQARLEKLVQRDANAFMAAFFKLIRPILVEWERKPATERLVQLVVRVTVCPTVLPLARKILLHLLDRSDLTERAVRLRCCQIIAGVLTALPEDYEIECGTSFPSCVPDRLAGRTSGLDFRRLY